MSQALVDKKNNSEHARVETVGDELMVVPFLLGDLMREVATCLYHGQRAYCLTDKQDSRAWSNSDMESFVSQMLCWGALLQEDEVRYSGSSLTQACPDTEYLPLWPDIGFEQEFCDAKDVGKVVADAVLDEKGCASPLSASYPTVYIQLRFTHSPSRGGYCSSEL